MRLDAVNADRKTTDPVALRVDKVGEAHIGAPLSFCDLLAEEGQADVVFAIEMDDHIVAFTTAGP